MLEQLPAEPAADRVACRAKVEVLQFSINGTTARGVSDDLDDEIEDDIRQSTCLPLDLEGDP